MSERNDLNQFHNQRCQVSENTGNKPRQACSDSGYFSLKDLKQVPEDITGIMPSQKQAQKENDFQPLKPFDKERFQYDSDKDEYICPEGKRLQYVGEAFSSTRKRAYEAAGKACRACPHFGVCTTSRDGRRVVRMAEDRSKNVLKICIIALKGKKYTALAKTESGITLWQYKAELRGRAIFVTG